ncbi:SGNH/GDSL hydrolase family protein [Clostridium perfringens]|nr:SGNH/GDSL hydrolase family protein [Clostridium perfringens]
MKEIIVNVDSYNENSIRTVEGDNLSEVYKIYILKNKRRIDLTNKIAVMAYVDEYGSKRSNILNLNITNTAEGEIELPITNVISRENGVYACEIAIYGENNFLEQTAPFSLIVENNIFSKISNTAINSTDFHILSEAIKTTSEYAEKLKQGTENIELQYAENLNTLTLDINNIKQEKAEKTKVNLLENRMSNLVANNGNGEKDSEIIDARGNENSLGDRFNLIDSNGYIIKDGIEVGNPRYINSYEVGKGWGTIFKPQNDTIAQILIRKSSVKGQRPSVDSDVVIKLVECSSSSPDGYNNGTVLETITINSDEWNNLNFDLDYLLNLKRIYKINKEKFYAVTIFNSNKINVSQVGFNTSYETELSSGGYKTEAFVRGIFTNDDNNSNYLEVSNNSYGLYVKILGENYSKKIKIEQEQVPGLKEKIKEIEEKPITLEELPFLSDEYIKIGNSIDTGEKSIQFDKFGKWTTVIKGADFKINKITLYKYLESKIQNDITIKFYECNNESSWINESPVFQKTIIADEFNLLELGEFSLELGFEISCNHEKYYALQVLSDSVGLGLAQSGEDLLGREKVSEYFINGYYNNGTTWNIIGKNYGLYFKLYSVDYGKLAKIKYDQVEGLKEENQKIEESVNALKIKAEEKKNHENYIEVFNENFENLNSNWKDFNSNWKCNNGLIPIAHGETTSNNIRLNKPYHCDKRILRFDIILYSDTVIDINMERNNSNNGEGESIYRIDVPNNEIIMFGANSNTRGVDLNNKLITSNINFPIINGNKYLVEIEKNDFEFYFRIKDYLTANITEAYIEGWGAGRQNHYYGFTFRSGETSPKIMNLKVSMLNNPTCVFVGDSITEGVGMSSTDINNKNNFNNRYAEIMRRKIGNSIISAMGGDTIGTILAKFDSEYNHIRPRSISVTIGTNGGVASNTLEQFKELIDKSYAIGCKLIINLVPCGFSGNYIGVNKILNTLSEDVSYKDKFILGCRFDLATAKDYYPTVDEMHPTTIVGQTTRVNSNLMVDNTHPNHLGSVEMAKRYSVDVPQIYVI